MKKIGILPVLVFAGVASCSQNPARQADKNAPFRGAQATGKINYKEIDEASGMTAGVNNPGLLWVHNDSGDEARIFLIDEEARYVATYYLEGVEAEDWEDITSAPGSGEGRHYLYIGDTGDNKARRDHVKIHRVEEPARRDEQAYTDTISRDRISTFVLRYEDGPRDAETLLADPLSGRFYVVTKREEKVRVYETSLPGEPAGDTLILKYRGELPYKKMVGGEISADGTEVLLKNYMKIWYWKRQSGQSVPELLRQKPRRLPYDPEPQGEAIAWKKDGSGFFTVSEEKKGLKSVLYYYSRK